jgi:hypothetical protein
MPSGGDRISIALVNTQSGVREQRKQGRHISFEATPVSNSRQPQPSSRFPARRVDTAPTDMREASLVRHALAHVQQHGSITQ